MVPSLVDLKVEASKMAAAPIDGSTESKSTAARETKFYVARYCLEDLLLKVDLNNAPEIPLRNISDFHVLFFGKSFLVNGFYHTIETFSVTTAVTTNVSARLKVLRWLPSHSE